VTKAEHGTAVFRLGGERRTDAWAYWTDPTRTNEKSCFVLRFSGISILTLFAISLRLMPNPWAMSRSGRTGTGSSKVTVT
jgi:hypothetical protein